MAMEMESTMRMEAMHRQRAEEDSLAALEKDIEARRLQMLADEKSKEQQWKIEDEERRLHTQNQRLEAEAKARARTEEVARKSLELELLRTEMQQRNRVRNT